MNWNNRLRELSGDHRSPSSVLAAKASQLLCDVAREDPELFADVARGVALAQPSMAALANVANVALRATQALGIASVEKALATLQQGLEADRRAAAEALRDAIAAEPDAPVRVVTLSASAGVVEALHLLREARLLDGIVCSESRPILEGTALARWLVERGYNVTLVADAGLCEHLVRGSVLVVGTDAILPDAIVNKVGTRVAATWARLAGVPRYVVATRDKLLPPALASMFSNPQRPPTELLQSPPEHLTVDNRAFDLTPRDAWTAIWVGRQPLASAEARGDHALAEAMKPLVEAGREQPAT
jgi:translation initiation factor 2B subunit (eIF-2B alpha/beta/delta family)